MASLLSKWVELGIFPAGTVSLQVEYFGQYIVFALFWLQLQEQVMFERMLMSHYSSSITSVKHFWICKSRTDYLQFWFHASWQGSITFLYQSRMESHYYAYMPIFANLVQDTNLKYDLSCFLKFHKTCTRILTTEFCVLLKIMSFASKSVRPFTIAVKVVFRKKEISILFRLQQMCAGWITYSLAQLIMP